MINEENDDKFSYGTLITYQKILDLIMLFDYDTVILKWFKTT